MDVNRKTVAAGIGGAAVLGVGLYLAVPAAAADPSPSPSKSAAQQKEHRKGQHRGPHKGQHKGHPHRWGGQGVHGEATVKRKDGFHVRTWQRGEVTGRSGAAVTVRSADGTSWTWTTDDQTRVRKDRAKSSVGALANGDRIVVVGERAGSTRTARMIRVPERR
ncbi:hypothetical protein [Spirillospora sp. NPDC029432]|uniref:hypothetical protein n=1 Tax=Spirillospora sp. NPDC029432 TaxID=3154599 RepID=UPI003453B940